MFRMINAKYTPLFVLAIAAPAASASTLANSTSDNDSYVFAKTDNVYSSELSLGSEVNAPHINFAVIEFDDLSGVSSTGSKFLVVDLETFITFGDVPDGGGQPPAIPSATGNATIKVVGLNSSLDDYFDIATYGPTWYSTNIGTPDADATATVTTTGLVYFDVTEVVDGWLDSPGTNNGFGLVVSSGDPVELGAGDESLGGGGVIPSNSVGPILSSVPEPGSLALLTLAGVCVMRRRR